MFVTTLPPAHADDPAAYSRTARDAGVDALEVRGDLTPGVGGFASVLPIVATPRGRDAAWVAALAPRWVDLALDEDVAVPAGAAVIRSWHDHAGTPPADDLRAIAERLAASGAAHTKLVTTVRTPADLVALESVRSAGDGDATVLAMGPLAWPVRILSPWRDAFTYVALPGEAASADGQLTIDAYPRGDERPALFGILGGPGMQTASPAIHTGLFRRHGVHAVYGAFPCEDARAMFGALAPFAPTGFSITAPHKTALLDVANALDSVASEVRAINTLVRRDGGWEGRQFDVHGIVEGYPFLRGVARAEVIGTGGVAPAVIHACRVLGIESIVVRGRDAARVAALAQRFGVHGRALDDASREPVDVVFWAIGGDPDLPLSRPAPGAHAIDLRYGATTAFQSHAAAQGYTPHDGTAMLHHQACAQFEAFTGIAVDVREISDR